MLIQLAEIEMDQQEQPVKGMSVWLKLSKPWQYSESH